VKLQIVNYTNHKLGIFLRMSDTGSLVRKGKKRDIENLQLAQEVIHLKYKEKMNPLAINRQLYVSINVKESLFFLQFNK
jgi:hypothetical protein